MEKASRKTVILHCGTGKTGSTSIQYFLAHSSAYLKSFNIHVPDFMGPSGLHIWLPICFFPDDDPRIVLATPFVQECLFNLKDRDQRRLAINEKLTQLKMFIESLPIEATIVLSCEWLFDIPEASVLAIKEFFSEYNLSIIIYIREPVSYLRSTWMQSIVNGSTSSLSSMINMLLDVNSQSLVNIFESIVRWSRHFDGKICFRRFDKQYLYKNSLICDFARICGVYCLDKSIKNDYRKNSSLSWSALKILARINMYLRNPIAKGRDKIYVWLKSYKGALSLYKPSLEEIEFANIYYEPLNEYLASDIFDIGIQSLWSKYIEPRTQDEHIIYGFDLTQEESDVLNLLIAILQDPVFAEHIPDFANISNKSF